RDRVAADYAAVNHLAGQAAHRREVAALAGGRKAAIGQRFQVAREGAPLELAWPNPVQPAEFLKASQVAGVRLERVRAERAFHAQPHQVRIDERIPAGFPRGARAQATPPSAGCCLSLSSSVSRSSRSRARSVTFSPWRSLI